MSDCPDCCDLAENGGRNVLRFAVETNTYKVMRTITDHASLANLINQKYKEGNTPVHLLAAIGFFPLGIVNHRLVDKKAVNKGNLTALDVVDVQKEAYRGLDMNEFGIQSGRQYLIGRQHSTAIARSHSVSKQRPEHGPMKRLSAAKKEEEESIEFVKLVISKCPSLLAEPNIRGETPLHLAARFGHNNIVEFLIRDIKNAQYEDLESSAEASTSDKMLKKTSPDGDTALHEAVRYDHPRVVETLIRENPEFANIANAARESPLYLAALRNNNIIASKILEKCTSSAAYSGPNGRTALHEAVISEDKDLTEKLLKQKSHLAKEQDNEGWTPLHYASYANHLSIVEMLLEYDKSATYIGDKVGKTPLHIAILNGNRHVKMVKKIISYCPDCCDLVDKRGRNVLHFAVEGDSNEGFRTLIEKPFLANLINQKDEDGNTPIHLFATHDFYAGNLIQQHTIDKMIVNKENLTALDVVVATKNESFGIFLGSTAKHLKKPGYKRGRHSIRQAPPHIMSTIDNELITYLGKASESHQIVATLIATVTFAAGFTLPGGYSGQDGPDEGTAILTRKSAFKTFLVTDTLALALSIFAVLIHFILAMQPPKRKFYDLFFRAYHFTVVALALMVVAFMTGVYAVLPHSSSGLGAAICVIGSCLALLCCWVLKAAFVIEFN
ncbi:ankyrin repeat-containing protein At5g02620-like [Hevea brasiliensis]|uniref:ankyrin repeat-containing protein At5g02620-like n=1 Tax=Hevea brasiliensis TaxID=3981 RepID=UPI0025D81BB6|nr:ankyrin repeat-containing protein At5g02620-like [Hevea brasiliensis]